MKNLRVNERLLKVPIYVPGKSVQEVQQELGLTEVIKLASNENAMGPSPKAIEALTASLSQAHRYPGPAMRDLQRALAEHFGQGLTPDHFVIGNGATDVIRIIAQAFLFEGGESVMGTVTFPMFGMTTSLFGGRSVRVQMTAEHALDLAAIEAAVTAETRVVWLCSPNNPTGLVLRQEQVDGLVERLEGRCLVVLDEAYCDYVTAEGAVDGLRYVRQGRSVVVVRSFSKCAGLAGLRLGYGITRPDIVEYLLHILMPFSTSTAAIRAGMASLEDHEFQRASNDLVLREREFLYQGMSALGLQCLPSQANFVMALDVPGGGPAFAERLMQKGMIVRSLDIFGDDRSIRVTVGTHDQNQRFLAVLGQVLAGSDDSRG